ncbi:MAG TPA: ATP-binding cassette domain-containing protein [Bacilli bacterium]|nr:ATP-binding cassette domain-containing protein [Bacilli bacterium]HOR53062.1 ATP-binding cassette domain-containing protein [Bacilli bacterium]
MVFLETKNLSFKYLDNSFTLSDINFSLDKGDFCLVVGKTGCGKTTLLKLLKKEITPSGELKGLVKIDGFDLKDYDSSKIVYMFQNPSRQIVSDKVYHEIVFGLEARGLEKGVIETKLAEIVNYLDINDLLEKHTMELSGGEAQLVSLASLLVLDPEVILLDEASSQLDPLTRKKFLEILKRINQDFGITIILVEHNLEDVLEFTDKIIVLDKGKMIYFGLKEEAINFLASNKQYFAFLPKTLQISKYLDLGSLLHLKDVKEALKNKYKNEINFSYEAKVFEKEIIKAEDLYYRYSKKEKDVLEKLSLTVYDNEILGLVGGNGVGKTTLLKNLAGIRSFYSGKIEIENKNIRKYKGNILYKNLIAYLPQDPLTLFLKRTVGEDLEYYVKSLDLDKALLEELLVKFDLKPLLEMSPYDLSGGELQKAAFTKILLSKPKILFLDEPTKGMDFSLREELKEILMDLKAKGATIIIATHDLEFIASVADRVGIMFNGKVLSLTDSHSFFSNSNFYTTVASLASRDLYDKVITVPELVEIAKKNGIKNEKDN